MTKAELKLTKPVYEDMVVIELQGDYNDADYTYDTISVSLAAYEIVMPILKSLTGRYKWRDEDDRVELGEKALDKLNIRENDPLYDEVLGPLDDIYLYSSDGGCHTMEIMGVYFESAEDTIRYKVQY